MAPGTSLAIGRGMRSLFFCSIVALSALTTACTDPTDTSGTETELQASPDPALPYRAVVSLGSYAAGIDGDAYDAITALWSSYDIDLRPHSFAWGLEGEVNLCFALKGLNAQAQANFVDELRAIAATGFLVFVYESSPCNTFE